MSYNIIYGKEVPNRTPTNRGYAVNAWNECWFQVNGVLSTLHDP
jgi:hypothetical protein